MRASNGARTGMSVSKERLFLVVALALFGFLGDAHAKRFANQYCEFELPTGWACSLEGSEWVCQSENKDRKKEAIIILAAKVRGDQDTLEQYQDYLSRPKTYTLPGGRSQVSEAKYNKPMDIYGQKWIDALHLASEVPGFYTRYLATVKSSLGIAVTFSVSKEHYEDYQKVFDQVVNSLRAFEPKAMDMADVKIRPKDGDGASDSTFMPDTEGPLDISATQQKQKNTSAADKVDAFILIAVLIGLVGFFVYKKRKKK